MIPSRFSSLHANPVPAFAAAVSPSSGSPSSAHAGPGASPSGSPRPARGARTARAAGVELFALQAIPAASGTRPEGQTRRLFEGQEGARAIARSGAASDDVLRSFAVALLSSGFFLGAGYVLLWKPLLDRWLF